VKGNDQIAKMADQRLDKEFRARVAGTHDATTFDLEDLSKHVHLVKLAGDALEDVKKIVLFADEKRKLQEDFRAFRRNYNDWYALIAAIAIAIACHFILHSSWITDVLILMPQMVMLAVRTKKMY
jgi:predicted exporter